VGGLALMIYRAATMTTLPPMGGMVGAWGPLGAPKYGEVKQ
jgi:hypothetical protein